jgi:hypothetical protein
LVETDTHQWCARSGFEPPVRFRKFFGGSVRFREIMSAHVCSHVNNRANCLRSVYCFLIFSNKRDARSFNQSISDSKRRQDERYDYSFESYSELCNKPFNCTFRHSKAGMCGVGTCVCSAIDRFLLIRGRKFSRQSLSRRSSGTFSYFSQHTFFCVFFQM